MPSEHTTRPIGLTIYCGRAGDHNDRAMPGALVLGQALSRRLGLAAATIGEPGSALNAGWEAELAEAMPFLLAFAEHVDELFRRGLAPLSIMSRCAVALGTLPVLARHRPDAFVVWLDAHGDLNTPATTLSGYLGGMALAGPLGLWESGLGDGLMPENLVLVGARDLDPGEQALVEAGKVRMIPNTGEMLAQLRAAVAGQAVYLHLDCDVLEPGIVPTDYRVPGGLTLAELHAVCELLAQQEVIGLEIGEFELAWPDAGAPASPDALLDALAPVLARLGQHQ